MAAFDPNKYLAEKQAAQADSPSVGNGFDPNQYMQSNGIQTNPNNGNIQNGPSTAEAVARAGQKGASFRLGNAAAAIAGSVFPTQTDDALGRSWSDRVLNINDQLDSENKAADAAHPTASAITELLSSLPATVAGGAAMKAIGIGSQIAQAGIMGGLFGLGGSSKKDATTAIADTAKSALFSAGLAGAGSLVAKGVGKFASELPEANLSSSVDELGNELKPDVTTMVKQPNGDFQINYGVGAKQSFTVGKDMRAAMAQPQVQNQVIQDLVQQQGKVADLVKSTKENLGNLKDALVEQHGDAPTDLQGTFSKAYDMVKKIAPEGDEAAIKQQKALADRIAQYEDILRGHSPTGSLTDVPLANAVDAQSELGSIIFDQKAYQKIPAINGAAKSFWGSLADGTSKADIAGGSGGDLANINKMFKTMYAMDENALSGATIKGLTDPQNASAYKAYSDFITPFSKLDPGVRTALAPEMEKYITQDFQKSLLKAQIMRLATGRVPMETDLGAVGSVLKKINDRSTLSNLANRAGAAASGIGDFFQSAPPSAGPSLNSFQGMSIPGSQLGSAASAATPALGAMTSNPGSPQGSLRQIK